MTDYHPTRPRPGFALLFAAALALATAPAGAARIKDLTEVEGGRDNQLVGYGIVVGLAGDGDSKLSFTNQSIANALERFGVQVDANGVKAKNVAAVMVTADIGPYARPGTRIDVTVSSLGDADSLQGGILLQTPLEGADREVYAVAQGSIAVGGFIGGEGGPGGATVQKNHPTVGVISGGAIVEREIKTELLLDGALNLVLRSPDPASAARVAEAVNKPFSGSARALDAGTVAVVVPAAYRGHVVDFLAVIGALEVVPDLPARIILNERTGTIVATDTVRLSKVAISHGSLTITISSNLNVSQPAPLSEKGDTVVTPSTQTDVQEFKGAFQVIDELPTIERLTTALNALGVTTREMMSILQALKGAGALQAELVLN